MLVVCRALGFNTFEICKRFRMFLLTGSSLSSRRRMSKRATKFMILEDIGRIFGHFYLMLATRSFQIDFGWKARLSKCDSASARHRSHLNTWAFASCPLWIHQRAPCGKCWLQAHDIISTSRLLNSSKTCVFPHLPVKSGPSNSIGPCSGHTMPAALLWHCTGSLYEVAVWSTFIQIEKIR